MFDVIPTQVLTAATVLAAGMTGLALGASGLTVMFFAPLSFRRLDYQRADSLVRLATKSILPLIAWVAIAGAALAFIGGAITAGLMLLIASGGLLLVRWVLNPLPKKMRMPGAVRRKSKQRILALHVMLVVSLMFPAALAALAAQI